jgi:hypothetical protein
MCEASNIQLLPEPIPYSDENKELVESRYKYVPPPAPLRIVPKVAITPPSLTKPVQSVTSSIMKDKDVQAAGKAVAKTIVKGVFNAISPIKI